MATNKFFKSLLFTLTIAISLFGFCIENSEHILYLLNKVIQIHVQQMEN